MTEVMRTLHAWNYFIQIKDARVGANEPMHWKMNLPPSSEASMLLNLRQYN